MNAFDPKNPGTYFFSPGFNLMKVVSSEEITGQQYRWEYTMRQVDIDDTDMRETANYVSRGDTFKAYNVLEFSNTVANAGGYDPENIPDGFEFKPVSGYVLGFSGNAVVNDIPQDVAFFSAVNPIDGECE